jgi:hypothetical protein
MNITMNDSQIQTIPQIEQFIQGSEGIRFRGKSKVEIYEWIEKALIKYKYIKLRKKEKGLIYQYMMKMTGYSRAQINRLILRYKETGKVRVTEYVRYKFTCQYSPEDIQLLARTDDAHNYPNAAALKKTLNRQYKIFGKEEYKQISQISISHIYNIRRSVIYQRTGSWYNKTKRETGQGLGIKKKPEPKGKPGYLRVDSVHQGDHEDGRKGVYHVNLIDEVTQFEYITTVVCLNSQEVRKALERALHFFPFVIKGFHSDNGTEYVNEDVAQALLQCLIYFTRSRSGKSNDNALVEGKNGSIVRKWIKYEFMEKKDVEGVNRFWITFNEYINYHRVCAFAQVQEDPRKRGKRKKVYKYEDYMTPYEKLKSLPNAKRYLKKGVTFARLNARAMRMSDNDMAIRVQDELKIMLQITQSSSR